jgi:seryl-tRNA synthetase
MLDIALLRRDLPAVLASLRRRKDPQPYLDETQFAALESDRKRIQTRTEELQAQRNSLSKQIGQLKGKGQHAEADTAMAQVNRIKTELDESATKLGLIQQQMDAMLLALPNLPHADVPTGSDEHGNVEVRRWGTPRSFDFAVKDHVDLGATLGLDFEVAAKLSGARFSFLKGPAARCTERWRSSCWTCRPSSTATPSATRPTSSTAETLRGTGQLPKFKDDMFWVTVAGPTEAEAGEQYLISTSEITLTNTVRDRILPKPTCRSSSPRTARASARRPAAPGATRAA